MKKFVVAHILSPDKKEVFLVKKDKPNKPYFHGKLLGFGGLIEEFDNSIEDALIREIKEELNLNLKDDQYQLKGEFIDPNEGLVYVFHIDLDYKLKEGYIENEGFAKYYPIDYYKTHLDEFLKHDDIILDASFHQEKYFIINLGDYEN